MASIPFRIAFLSLVSVATFFASAQSSPWGTLDERLKSSTERANQSLPRMISEGLRQEKISTAANGVLVVSYTALRAVSREEIDYINTQGRSGTIASVCAIGMTRTALDLGATVRYALRDQKGNMISTIEVTKHHCL